MSGSGFAPHSNQTNYKPCSHNVNLLYQNVRGLRTKTTQFLSLLGSSESDLFAITESGLSESIQDAELVLPGYQVVRCDRADGRKQGGVMVVAGPRFQLRQVLVPSDVDIDKCKFELVCTAIYMNNRFLFACCVVYIPPLTDENEYMLMFNILEKWCVKYKNNFILIGDFNLYSCNNNIVNYFEYFMSFCGFTQFNKVPNCNNRQLDLVLSASAGAGVSVSVSAADEGILPVDAYHPALAVGIEINGRAPLSTRLSCDDVVLPADGGDAAAPCAPGGANASALYSNTRKKRSQYNFYKADYELLYSMLGSTDWSEMYDMTDLEDILDFFYDNIYSILDESVPLKKQCSKSKYVYPLWYTTEIISGLKTKAALHKRFKQNRSSIDYTNYSKFRSHIKKLINIAYVQHKNKLQCQFAKDPKSFWQFVRSQRGAMGKQAIVKDGKYLSDGECAQQFAAFFESVYSTDPPRLDPQEASASANTGNNTEVEIGQLTVKDVRSALERLKPKRSAGPDGLPAFLVKDCSRVLAEPLRYIFNKCLSLATFPTRWKITRVIPVPKGKASSNIDGYRPVAVLSSPAKVFESAVQRSLQAQTHGQMSDSQHGFRPGRSTATNLLSFMTRVVPAVDAGVQVDAAYFDFRKAFDTVDNDILLRKLVEIGCKPQLVQFLASYMKDRQQYVDYNGWESDPYYTRSGVSQGSNLGPLEFLIMINSLPEVVKHGTCLLFADDLKLLLEIRNEADCRCLQDDIDRIVQWSQENKLYFNESKCSTISFTRARSPLLHEYRLENTPLQRVTQVRDLGVYMTPELLFREHIMKICKKAYRNLGFLLRQTRDFTNISAVRALYDALVRSHLEHSAMIWAPHESKYSLMLERVQNKFTRHLYWKLYGVYPLYPLMYPSLFVLGMVGYNELKVRREFTLTTYLVKLIRGLEHNPDVLQRISLWVPDNYVGRRRRPPLLAVPVARTNLLAKAAVTRAIRNINVVHEQIDIFTCQQSEFTKILLYNLCYR